MDYLTVVDRIARAEKMDQHDILPLVYPTLNGLVLLGFEATNKHHMTYCWDQNGKLITIQIDRAIAVQMLWKHLLKTVN